MPFKLDSVVPWGRNIDEYRRMFMLTDADMSKKIADFGSGPASFNAQASERGCSVASFDPIYRCTREQIAQRISAVSGAVIRQTEENRENYIWMQIKSPDELESIRMSAMRLFLEDFERGRQEGRYICHELPSTLPCAQDTFDIGLSSHFLLMYTSLGYDFHIKAITEMLRACRQVRIFPIVDLNADASELAESVIRYFGSRYSVSITDTDYAFQKGENKLLIIQK